MVDERRGIISLHDQIRLREGFLHIPYAMTELSHHIPVLVHEGSSRHKCFLGGKDAFQFSIFNRNRLTSLLG